MEKSDKITIPNICRGCLLNLDTSGCETFHLAVGSSCIERFQLCTHIFIDKDDQLPKNLCRLCMDKCNSWYDFKKQCDESSEILQRIVSQKRSCAEFVELPGTLVFAFAETSNDIVDLDSVNLSEIDIEIHKPETIQNVDEASGEATEDSGKEVILISEDEKIPEKHETKKTTSSRYKYRCIICKKPFRNEERLEAHVREHNGLKPEVCKVCHKEFNNLRALRRHRTKHNDLKQFSCQTCGKQYKYATSLSLHIKSHKNIRRYVCDHCGKSFVRAHGLQSHMLSHQTEKPFACEFCIKTFKSQMMLKNHEMRHKGVKRFVCAVCGKSFTTSPELTTHTRSHTGAKPFDCSMCEKSYKTKSHLAVHMRSHTGSRPYACDLCPQKFAHNKVLKQHRLTHTGEMPYICDVCQRPFRQRSTLRSHLKTHKQTEEPSNQTTTNQITVTYLTIDQPIQIHQNGFISM
ncbi:hypothetical protein DMENIID0001_098000 [Sergentomyia squamirostris]